MEENIPEVPAVGSTTPATEKTVVPQGHDVYWKFLDELEALMKSFICEARAGDINKQAALRARKMSLAIGKSLKEYREVSVAHDKSHVRSRRTNRELAKEIQTLES